MVWGGIAYDTRSPLILIQDTMTTSGTTMTSVSHMCCHSWKDTHEPFIQKQCSATHSNGVTRLLSPHYHLFLICSLSRLVTSRAYLGSLVTTNWTAYEFGRTRGTFTATVERDVSGYYMELVFLNAHSCHIMDSC
ncbi:transposable element Tcb1 transposase [Trichonephila clavipes]|nr:transposable element Tcb1 transposase [Trichonephila clavipes]